MTKQFFPAICISAVVALFAGGCKKSTGQGETVAGTTPAAAYSQIDYNTSGTISGTIKLCEEGSSAD